MSKFYINEQVWSDGVKSYTVVEEIDKEYGYIHYFCERSKDLVEKYTKISTPVSKEEITKMVDYYVDKAARRNFPHLYN